MVKIINCGKSAKNNTEVVLTEEKNKDKNYPSFFIYAEGNCVGTVECWPKSGIFLSIDSEENQRKGYGTLAFMHFINYLFEKKDYQVIKTQPMDNNSVLFHNSLGLSKAEKKVDLIITKDEFKPIFDKFIENREEKGFVLEKTKMISCVNKCNIS